MPSQERICELCCVADFKRLRLGVLLPMTGDWPIGRSVIGAVSLAVQDVNNDPRLLPGRKLEFAPVRVFSAPFCTIATPFRTIGTAGRCEMIAAAS